MIALDVVLALSLGVNVLVVAVTLGAYGRVLGALGPGHYPLELLAAAIAVAAYLDARRRARLRHGELLACGLACAAVLLVAAIIESAEARSDGAAAPAAVTRSPTRRP